MSPKPFLENGNRIIETGYGIILPTYILLIKTPWPQLWDPTSTLGPYLNSRTRRQLYDQTSTIGTNINFRIRPQL